MSCYSETVRSQANAANYKSYQNIFLSRKQAKWSQVYVKCQTGWSSHVSYLPVRRIGTILTPIILCAKCRQPQVQFCVLQRTAKNERHILALF